MSNEKSIIPQVLNKVITSTVSGFGVFILLSLAPDIPAIINLLISFIFVSIASMNFSYDLYNLREYGHFENED